MAKIFAIVLGVLVASAYLAWHFLAAPTGAAPPASSPPAKPVRIEAVQALRGPASSRFQGVGTLMAAESVVLRPEIAGRIQLIRVTEGASVKSGAMLIELNSDELRAAVSRSEAQEALEQQSFERISAVRGRNLVSAQQYDEAMARLKNATAQLEQDRVRLAKTRLTAPFSGVLGLRQVSPGDYVSPGQDLVNLEAIDPIKVDFQVPEKYAGRVGPGMPLEIRVDAYPQQVFSGAVYAVDPRLEENTRSLRLRAKLANPQSRLKPGMFARIELELGGGREAVFVPEQALVPKGSATSVFRVDGDRVSAVSVEIGERKAGKVEIVQGLEGGEWIATEGQMKLRNGMKVAVDRQPAP